jgi:alkylation response protein AidB-like acyl-CoA dehydrogenase
MERDQTGAYPHELHAALAKDGWIGIALPEELGGAGLGISEATMMLHTISEYVKPVVMYNLTLLCPEAEPASPVPSPFMPMCMLHR